MDYLDIDGYLELKNSEIYLNLNAKGPEILISNCYLNNASITGDVIIKKVTGSKINILGNAKIYEADGLDFLDIIGKGRIVDSYIKSFKSTGNLVAENSKMNRVSTNAEYIHLWDSKIGNLQIMNYDPKNKQDIKINILNHTNIKELTITTANPDISINFIFDDSTAKYVEKLKKSIKNKINIKYL